MWVFSLALFPLGLGGVILGPLDAVKGHQSLKWTQTQGTVLSSRLLPSVLAPDQPDVRYTYSFDNKTYVSNRIWPGSFLPYMPVWRGEARQLTEEFSKDKMITVYLNPANPVETALIPGAKKATRWIIVFTSFLMLGVWSPLALWRVLERRRKGPL